MSKKNWPRLFVGDACLTIPEAWDCWAFNGRLYRRTLHRSVEVLDGDRWVHWAWLIEAA